jgi:ADP-ribose pyrophosphatase
MEIVSTEKITHERWVNLFARVYRHNDHEGRWTFASRGDGTLPPPGQYDAVVIVPVVVSEDAPPRLVMLREYRVPVGDYIHAFPAGLAEEGERPEDVARRELGEETGLEVVAVTQVSPPIFSSAGLTDESAVMVFVTARLPSGAVQTLDHSEEIEVLFLDHAQVCELCRSGARIDAKAWVVLYMYQLLGKLV